MTRLLVSVRSIDEALLAAEGGADFIDLKEPGRGALGGLPVATINDIVEALRARAIELPVSATIGDHSMSDSTSAWPAIQARVQAVGDCGVDYVKVGIEPAPGAFAVLEGLARCRHPVVPVFIADRGLDAGLLAHALTLGFPGLMADTADKKAGSLFDVVSIAELKAFIDPVRARGVMVGIAGALRLPHLAAVAALAPDFAGFRSAVCAGDRSGALEIGRVRELVGAMRAASGAAAALTPALSISL